jgi:hypothetical protein
MKIELGDTFTINCILEQTKRRNQLVKDILF